MDKGTIAIDLDGVIFDFEGEFCDRFGSQNRHMFNLFLRQPSVDPELIYEFLRTPENYANLMTLMGGVYLVNKVRDLGFRVVFLTNREIILDRVTVNSLSRIGFNDMTILYAINKGRLIDDWNSAAQSKIKMLVDDNPQTFDTLPEDVLGVCWEQPWNTGVYPRGRYNSQLGRLEIKMDNESPWKEIFVVDN